MSSHKEIKKAQFGAIVRAGKRIGAGFNAATDAYKAASAAEKLNQVKAAKRAAAVEKAKATRAANKAAKLKAAEEAAAATPKKGRKPKVAPTTEPVAPKKTRATKQTKEQQKRAEQDAKTQKTVGRIVTGTAIAGVLGGVSALASGKKKYVAPKTSTPQADTTTFKPKGIVKDVLKSAGKYKFAKGGSMASKPGAAKYSKMTTKQTRSAASAVKAISTGKPMMRPSIKKK